MTATTWDPSVNARTLLLPYTLGLVAAMVTIQAVIAFSGGEVGLVAALLTAVVALGIAGWLGVNRHALAHVRFGAAMAHAIAYVAVTTSFNLHAAVRTISLGAGEGGFDAAAQALLATPWFGATVIMSAAWGLGLLVHLTGAVLGRGWDA